MNNPHLRALRRFAITVIKASPRRAAESLFITLAVGIVEGVGLLLLLPLLQLVGVNATGTALGTTTGRVGAAFRAVGAQPTLPVVLAVYVAIVAAQTALQRRQSTVASALRHHVIERMRERVYWAVASAKWVFFAKSRSSNYAHVLTTEIDRVGTITTFLIDLTVSVAIATAYIALAFRVSVSMTTLVMFCGLLLVAFGRRPINEARETGRRWSKAWSDLHAAITEHLGSMKMAKGYGAEARHAALFGRLSKELGDVQLVAVDSRAQVNQLFTVGSAVVLAVIVYTASGVMGMSAASLLLLLFIFGRLMPRLTTLYEKAQILAIELPAFEAVVEIEQRCLAAAAAPVASPVQVTLTDRIAFDRVTFSYEEGKPPALRDVSLVMAARSTTAVIGPSGAGKSTIADVLMGLLEPSEGSVRVDGAPLTPEGFASWRDQIGYVSQDTFLFHDTVLANLLWAKPEASTDEVWSALTLAAADEFVRHLPQGLSTLVGDRGVLISGGERQRLSLARALLRQPKLLILDEATSSLDSENERRIQDAIERLHERMTIVVITHRLSTVRQADIIHVVENGQVVESGRWEELARRGSSRFRDLCHAQGIDLDPASSEHGFASAASV